MSLNFNRKQFPITNIFAIICFTGFFILGFIYINLNIPGLSAQNRNVDARKDIFKAEIYLNRRSCLQNSFPVYQVGEGETLYTVSTRFFVTPQALISLNQIDDIRNIIVGQKLFIPPVNFSHRSLQNYSIQKGDTLKSILVRYNLQVWQFFRLNPKIKDSLPVGTTIVLPRQRELVNRGQKGNIRLIRPVRGFLSSGFGKRWGRMHFGIDLAAPTGTPVHAAAAGEVIFAGWRNGYGQMISLRHGHYLTHYGHLSEILVTEGEEIAQGQSIGLVGQTGRAYGSHLHFEVEMNQTKVNPIDFLEK